MIAYTNDIILLQWVSSCILWTPAVLVALHVFLNNAPFFSLSFLFFLFKIPLLSPSGFLSHAPISNSADDKFFKKKKRSYPLPLGYPRLFFSATLLFLVFFLSVYHLRVIPSSVSLNVSLPCFRYRLLPSLSPVFSSTLSSTTYPSPENSRALASFPLSLPEVFFPIWSLFPLTLYHYILSPFLLFPRLSVNESKFLLPTDDFERRKK